MYVLLKGKVEAAKIKLSSITDLSYDVLFSFKRFGEKIYRCARWWPDKKAGVVSSSFYPKASPPKAIHISKKLAIRQTKKDFSEFSFSTRYRLCINEPYCCKSNNSYFSSFLPLKQQRIIAKILRCIPKKKPPFSFSFLL